MCCNADGSTCEHSPPRSKGREHHDKALRVEAASQSRVRRAMASNGSAQAPLVRLPLRSLTEMLRCKSGRPCASMYGPAVRRKGEHWADLLQVETLLLPADAADSLEIQS